MILKIVKVVQNIFSGTTISKLEVKKNKRSMALYKHTVHARSEIGFRQNENSTPTN
jgi:hypothetical protein